MSFLSTAVQAEQARHILRRRDQAGVEKAIETKAELIEKAMDLAADDFGGDVPDDVQIAIFQDPGAYIKAGESKEDTNCEDCQSAYDEALAVADENEAARARIEFAKSLKG